MPSLLIIDDRDQTVEMCQRQLPDLELLTRCGKPIPCRVCEERDKGCRLRIAHDWFEAEAALASNARLPDLVLLDMHFALPEERLLKDGPLERSRRQQGLLILKKLRETHPTLPVILLTTEDDAPSDDPMLFFCEDEVVDSRSLATEITRALGRSSEASEGNVYWGEGLKDTRDRLLSAARSPLPLLIEGETGTGKSFFAEHVVHPRSGRKGPCVVTDLSTVPEGLLAAHLFGSKRGAYTGAHEDHAGVFEQAHGGTLFIDEIGNASLDVQKQLLVVLERGTVTRLGEARPRPAQCKVIAATQSSLAALVRAGSFRRDLYMRLNPGGRLVLPPVRERRAEIPALLAHAMQEALRSESLRELVSAFLARFPTPRPFDETKTILRFGRARAKDASADGFTVFVSDKARDRLMRHRFAGNMRELKLLALNLAVELLDEAASARTTSTTAAPAILIAQDTQIDRLLAGTSERASDDGDIKVTVAKGATFARIASEVERQYLLALLRQEQGDVEKLGERLFGTRGQGRRVRLRLNQLGVKLKELEWRR